MWRLLFVLVVAGCAVRGGVPAPAAAELMVLVAFDGFRWDYDRKAPAPHLQRLAAEGVRADGLIPGFPSKTIPNMYSLATGLYPGHHGMVANTLIDPATGRRFERSRQSEVVDPMWWGGEPIWTIAERAGRNAGVMFWAGAEVPNARYPIEHERFDDAMPDATRVDRMLAWLDLPADRRPSLLAVYLNDADRAAHFYGPDSPQTRDAITALDAQLGRIVAALDQRGLGDRANVVVVSDHGMAEARQERTIVADDHLRPEEGEIVDHNPTLGVIPAPGREATVYATLSRAHPNLTVYRRAETPQHWRFRDQPRVPPIIGVADEGWVIIRRSEAATYWRRSPIGGQHGYDPTLPSMRGIFVAAGPAFRTGGVVVPAFDNVHVHHIVALAMGARPAMNDGDEAIARRVLRAR